MSDVKKIDKEATHLKCLYGFDAACVSQFSGVAFASCSGELHVSRNVISKCKRSRYDTRCRLGFLSESPNSLNCLVKDFLYQRTNVNDVP